MADIDAVQFAPRALFRQPLIHPGVTPFELFLLIEELERRGCRAADDPEMIGYAQYLFDRAAALREAGR